MSVALVHRNCAGLDVHLALLVCHHRRVLDNGEVVRERSEFGATLADLQVLEKWLLERGCSVVAMESTGEYWKPLYQILSRSMEVIVANPRAVKAPKGKKTDKQDAERIADLLALGQIPPSFIPTKPLAALRQLTRHRVTLVQTRGREENRVHKVLAQAGIKLSVVATDIFGLSGRRMLDAMVRGQTQASVLANLACGKLKSKKEQLLLALDGMLTERHRMLLGMSLELRDLLEQQRKTLEELMHQDAEPMRREVELLDSIPGINDLSAIQILAEIGPDRSRFGSSGRLASWVKLCPGNNESAGKRYSGRTGKGNRYVKRVLVQCAWSLWRMDNFLGATFRRLRARLGGKKAAVAMAHKLLVLVYEVLSQGQPYDESRYAPQLARQKERWTKFAIKRLQDNGYEVVPKTAGVTSEEPSAVGSTEVAEPLPSSTDVSAAQVQAIEPTAVGTPLLGDEVAESALSQDEATSPSARTVDMPKRPDACVPATVAALVAIGACVSHPAAALVTSESHEPQPPECSVAVTVAADPAQAPAGSVDGKPRRRKGQPTRVASSQGDRSAALRSPEGLPNPPSTRGKRARRRAGSQAEPPS